MYVHSYKIQIVRTTQYSLCRWDVSRIAQQERARRLVVPTPREPEGPPEATKFDVFTKETREITFFNFALCQIALSVVESREPTCIPYARVTNVHVESACLIRVVL